MQLSETVKLFPDLLILCSDGVFHTLGLTATTNDHATLCFIENEKYLNEIENNTSIACIITSKSIYTKMKNSEKYGVAISETPKHAFFSLHNYLIDKTSFYGSIEKTKISSDANIHPTAWIDDYGVSIETGTTIGPNTVIHRNVIIGSNVTIGSNSVIGSEGYENYQYGDGIITVRHGGSVIIKDNVSIHSNVCIDKGLFNNATLIQEYVQIDNLVHIAHNVFIGKRSKIVAHAMVAGRVIIGEDCWIGPSTSIRNGCTIGNHGFVSMGSVVTKDVEANQMVTGNFAIDHIKFIDHMKAIR